jgi:hypothetical protein
VRGYGGTSPSEYVAGIERAIAKGWVWRHEFRGCEIHSGRATLFA